MSLLDSGNRSRLHEVAQYLDTGVRLAGEGRAISPGHVMRSTALMDTVMRSVDEAAGYPPDLVVAANAVSVVHELGRMGEGIDPAVLARGARAIYDLLAG